MKEKTTINKHWITAVAILIAITMLTTGCKTTTPLTIVAGWHWDVDVSFKGGPPNGKNFTGERGRIIGFLGPVNRSANDLSSYSFWLQTNFPEEGLDDFYKDLAGKKHIEIRNDVADPESNKTWKDVWTRYQPVKQPNGSWMIEIRGLCKISDPTDISTNQFPVRPYILRLYTRDPSKPTSPSRFTLEVRLSKAQGVPQHRFEGKALVPYGHIEHIK